MKFVLFAGYGCSGKSTLAKATKDLCDLLKLKSEVIPQAMFIKKLFSAYFGKEFEKTLEDRENITNLAWALKGKQSEIDISIARQELQNLGFNSSMIKTTDFFPDLSYQLAKQLELEVMIVDDLRYPYEEQYYRRIDNKSVLVVKTLIDESILNDRIIKRYGHTLEELKKIDSEQHYHLITEDLLVNSENNIPENLLRSLKEFLSR